tara:strand:- start:796 stop:3036 length:2241 start_codon:yes stop_codon:yes gene_type:complete
MKNLFFIFTIIIGVVRPQANILIMSPNPNEEISNSEVLIAVSFYQIEEIIPSEIHLSVDGKEFSSKAFIDKDMLSCLVDGLSPGKHRITLILGSRMRPKMWSFYVTGEREVTSEYSGRIRSGSSVEQIDKQSLNISHVAFETKGRMDEGFSFKSNIKLTTQESKLYQARNIFNLGLNFNDYVKINFGDTNPRISFFTLNGKRIRGFDIKMKYGFLNFQIVKGKINRAVQGDLENAYNYSIETKDNGRKFISLKRAGYTFEQNLTVGRFALGRGKNFQWGLNLLKARDDTSSVKTKLEGASIIYNPSSFGSISGLTAGSTYLVNELGSNGEFKSGEYWSGTTPKDNLVIGSDIGIYLANKRILIEGEVAFSLTNNNIWGGPLTLAAMDTLIDDQIDSTILGINLQSFPDPADYSDWLIINPNLSPLVPIDMNAFDTIAPLPLNQAILSMPSLAYRGKTIINFFKNYFVLEYTQVGPEFNSLANPYLVKNKREISITDKLKLFRNRLLLTIGYKNQDDDILSSIENVESQNSTSIGVNFLPGPKIPNFNFTYRLIDRNNGIDRIIQLTDSTFSDNRDKTETKNIILNLSHQFEKKWSHNLNATYVMVNKIDKFSDRDTLFIDPSLFSNVANFTISTRYKIPLKTSINFILNSSRLSTGPGQIGKQSFFTSGINGEYSFFEKGFKINGGLNINLGSGIVDMNWIGIKLGMNWKLADGFNISSQADYRSKVINKETKNTLIARINIDYLF